MKHYITVIAGILALFSVTSCSLFSSSRQEVTITTNDSNAKIMIDGITYGKGQAVVSLPKRRTQVVMVENGSRRGYAQLHSEMSTTGVLDLIGGCLILIPFLGFLSGGAWTLDKDAVYVEAN